MAIIEQIATAALAQDALQLRGLVQQFSRTNPDFGALSMPTTDDPTTFAMAAAIIELLAQQAKQEPPSWTATAHPLPEPIFC